ncbi:hypothetical protein M0R89_12615 [Halorussus limi]|uniref:DUF2975 domain-containing protein n=1 Tax=Halorussus limi TaxID=2938695 RepID=A0A8U0HQR5_9EURY|nr:hypothetical protein [Halorussus limi]UPV73385.1 hypothetical protein M0R89_12615 [Halorussus limi]
MPSNVKSALFAAVRVVFVCVGVGVAAAIVLELASMPPPPPESDGFAHGMAAIVGGIIIVLALGLAAVGVSLPALLGRDDRLGFNRWQRLALKGAGVLIGGGIVVGLAFGFVTQLQLGIVLWLGLVALATVVVCATLVWRVAEVVVRLLYRAFDADIS